MIREGKVSAPVYLALLHYPVVNRHGEIVTSSVTNLDIHDISRSCRTYGVKGYFIVTPIVEQHELIGRILGFWRSSFQESYHPDRQEAVNLVRLVKSFDEVQQAVFAEHQKKPEVVLTDAQAKSSAVTYADYRRERLMSSDQDAPPVILVFGTAWGVAPAFYPAVDRILAPIYGPEGKDGYNHLSVRAAVAISLDRLLG